MKINREELKKALEIVKPGLSNKEIIEHSNKFAFIDGYLTTFNDEISIKYPLNQIDFNGVVDAQELYQFINKTKVTELNIVPQENQLLLRAGKSRVGLALENEVKLPLEEIGELGDWNDLPIDFIDALKFTNRCTSNDLLKAILTCIEINKKGFIQAGDNYRAVRWELDNKINIGNILIPSHIVRELIKLKPVQITMNKSNSGWVHFKNNESAIISCRIFNDDYPDTNHLFEITGISIVFPNTMFEILDRAIIFSDNHTENDKTVKISIKKDELKVYAKSDSGSWFEEKEKVPKINTDLEFYITPYLLKDVLQEIDSCVKDDCKLKFVGNKWQYITALGK